MEFLYTLSELRTPFFDAVFSVLTHLGGEIGFLAVAVAFLWCSRKKDGYYVLLTCFTGVLINQVLKLLCRVPRPWVRDPAFRPIEQALDEATGYSFPSGHTQNAAGLFGCIARMRPRTVKTVICMILIFVVAFSRMYLGVHTPADVLVSLGIAVVLVFAIAPFFSTEERFRHYMPYVLGTCYGLSVAFLLFTFLFPAHLTDGVNLTSAKEAACTMQGCLVGMIAVYIVDTRWLQYPTEGKWYAQAVKTVVGLALVLAVKTFLKTPLTVLCFGNVFVARVVRYFLVVIVAGILWPLTFRFFARWQVPFLDRFCQNLQGKSHKTNRDKTV